MTDNISDPLNPKVLSRQDEDLRVVDDETFNSVQQKIDLSLRRKNQVTKVIHKEVLLRGLLFCGVCGEIYGCRVKLKKNEFYYYCRSKENNWRKVDGSKKVQCSVKKSLNIKNTDGNVWNTLVEILGNSHLIKETIKKETLEDKIHDDDQLDERTVKLKQKKKYIENRIEELEERETENRNWYLKGEIDKSQFEEGLKLIRETKEERFKSLEDVKIDMDGISNSKKWINWLLKHSEWLQNLKSSIPIEEKKEIINTHIHRIDVGFEPKINQHTLKIEFRLPMVGDTYRISSEGKNRRYEIVSGERTTEISVQNPPVGRKKTSNDYGDDLKDEYPLSQLYRDC